MVNSHLKSKKQDKIIRFVYMLRDGLFVSKNRTKFFDFVLPVVPVVDSKNSENKLIELLEGDIKMPDRKLLAKIALYIDDMRLLKNIVNEYMVYQGIVAFDDLTLDPNKLFSLIVLKNIFPREFDFLQEDRGYIYQLFQNVGDFRQQLKDEYEAEIQGIEEKISFLNSRIEKSKFEILASLMPPYVRLNITDYKTWDSVLNYLYNNPVQTVDVSHAGGVLHKKLHI